jgi:hypothetical protein
MSFDGHRRTVPSRRSSTLDFVPEILHRERPAVLIKGALHLGSMEGDLISLYLFWCILIERRRSLVGTSRGLLNP